MQAVRDFVDVKTFAIRLVVKQALRCQLLDEVQKLCRETGRRFPSHLVIQSDNTTAQAKNQGVLLFLSYLVARGKQPARLGWAPGQM